MKRRLFFGFFVNGMFVSGCIRTFTSACHCCRCHCRLPLGHLFRLLVTRHSLSFVHFCFSCHPCHSESFTLPNHRLLLLLSRFLVLSSASHSFTSASLHHRQPLAHSLQLLIAMVDFSSSQDVLQESHKSGYGPER